MSHESQEVHEPDVVASRPVNAVAIGAAVILALSLGAVLLLLRPVTRESPRPAPATIGSIETAPILDGDRGRRIAAADRAGLEHGRWIDRDAGVVDLPLDIAIGRLLEQDGGGP